MNSNWYKKYLTKYLEQKPLKENKVIVEINSSTYHERVNLNPLVFKEGKGPFLIDINDVIYIDMGSGIYVTNCGHAHPHISKAIANQTMKLMNCHNYPTDIQVKYYDKLKKFLPENLNLIQLYDNGTTAIEFAIRLARQITKKYEIISFFSDHHGKTMGSASLGRINSSYNITRLPGFHLLPRPDNYRPLWTNDKNEIDLDKYFDYFELSLKEQTTGALETCVFEPIQGWGGVITPPKDFLKRLEIFLRQKGILLIIDEILTGVGRTGKMLSSWHYDVNPDILLLGKGLGNGFPMSALITKQDYYNEMSSLGPSTTYAGNPMACAAGYSTLEVIEKENIFENSTIIGNYILNELYKLQASSSYIGDIRGKGSLIAIEFVKDKKTKEPFIQMVNELYTACLEKNLIAGIPTIHFLRIAPVLNMDMKTTKIAVQILIDTIKEVEKKIKEENL